MVARVPFGMSICTVVCDVLNRPVGSSVKALNRARVRL